MNDLIIPARMSEAFPGLAQSIKRAAELFSGIHTWDDVERLLIRGAGLSKGTYKTYGYAVRAFYEHTGGLNPLQVVPADIEAWHEAMIAEGLKPATVSVRIAALKKFFSGLERELPGYSSPFRRMPEALLEKLRNRHNSEKCKVAMNAAEIRRTLEHVADKPIERAILTVLLASGLRASELCALSWGDLWRDEDDGRWWISGTGKGSKPYRLELHKSAVAAIRAAWRSVKGRRKPRPEEPLLVNAKGGRLSRQTVWQRIAAVGRELKAAGAVRQELEFSPHLMRRSFLTLLLKRGMDVKSVQRLSRHADAKTLLTHYIDGDESPAAILDEVLKGAAA